MKRALLTVAAALTGCSLAQADRVVFNTLDGNFFINYTDPTVEGGQAYHAPEFSLDLPNEGRLTATDPDPRGAAFAELDYTASVFENRTFFQLTTHVIRHDVAEGNSTTYVQGNTSFTLTEPMDYQFEIDPETQRLGLNFSNQVSSLFYSSDLGPEPDSGGSETGTISPGEYSIGFFNVADRAMGDTRANASFSLTLTPRATAIPTPAALPAGVLLMMTLTARRRRLA